MGCFSSKSKGFKFNPIINFPLSLGPNPLKRKYYSYCYIEERNEIYLFGGCSQNENNDSTISYADLYRYSITDDSWKKLWDGNEVLKKEYLKQSSSSLNKSVEKYIAEIEQGYEIPGPLGWYSCTMTYLKHLNAIIFLGGIRGNEDSEESAFINVWVWHINEVRWELLHTYGARPDVVRDHTVLYQSPLKLFPSKEQLHSTLSKEVNEEPKKYFNGDENNSNGSDIIETHVDKFTRSPDSQLDVNSQAKVLHYIRSNEDNFSSISNNLSSFEALSDNSQSNQDLNIPQTPQTPQTINLHKHSQQRKSQKILKPQFKPDLKNTSFHDISQVENDSDYSDTKIFSNSLQFDNDLHDRNKLYTTTGISPHSPGGKLILFGGHCGFTFPNPVFILDLESMSWIRSESEHSPMRRYGHSMHWMDESQEKLILFGGCIDYQTREIDNTVWVWSIETREWTVMRTRGAKPEPRYNHASLVQNNRMYIYGGHPFHEELYTRLYILDFQSNFWISKLLHQPIIDDFTLISSQTRMYSFLILMKPKSMEEMNLKDKIENKESELSIESKSNENSNSFRRSQVQRNRFSIRGDDGSSPDALFFDVMDNEIVLGKWLPLTGFIENTDLPLEH